MVKPSQHRFREHKRTRRQSLSGFGLREHQRLVRRIWHLRLLALVRPTLVVMLDPFKQDRAHVCRRHRHHPIPALPPHRLDRSSPQSGFSVAILRVSARSSAGSGGRPDRDLNRHSSLHPARRHRIMVAGCTTTRALRHSNSFASMAKLTRLAASTRRGRTPRSKNNANWRRRNRFSARTDFADWKRSSTHRKASSIRRIPILAKVSVGS